MVLKLQGDPSVLGYAIFTSAAPGNPAQDATAPAGAAPTRILAPFDNTSGFIAAFAVANPNAAAETISVPIGAGGFDSNGAAVRRDPDSGDVHGIEEIVEGEERFGGRRLGQCGGAKERQDEGAQ